MAFGHFFRDGFGCLARLEPRGFGKSGPNQGPSSSNSSSKSSPSKSSSSGKLRGNPGTPPGDGKPPKPLKGKPNGVDVSSLTTEEICLILGTKRVSAGRDEASARLKALSRCS